jgi:long-chain fatty acid transport protein
MSFLNRRKVTIGGGAVLPSTAYLRPNPGVELTRTEPVVMTPFFLYTVWRPENSSKVSLGLAINNPFATQIRWPELWTGRFISQEVDISSLFVQPSISYQLLPSLSLGLGVVLGNTNMLMRRAIWIGGAPANDVQPSVSLSGSQHGVGFNLGLYLQASPGLSLGVDYRSSVGFQSSQGIATFDVPPSVADQYPDQNYQSSFTLPDVLSVGIGYKPQEMFLLSFDLNYTFWSRYDTLVIDFEQEGQREEDFESVQNYKNALAIRWGMEYLPNDWLQLRGGMYFDGSPVRDGFVSPELPDANRIGLTAGLGLNLSKEISLDLAYQFETTGERTATLEALGFAGIYQTNTNALSLALNYSF